MQTQADLPTPNGSSYNSIVKAYANCGMADEATAVLEEMKTDGAQLRVFADNYEWAIKACGAGGNWERAVTLLKEVEAVDTTGKVAGACYDAVIDACGKNGQIDQAMVIFEKMKEKEALYLRPAVRTYDHFIMHPGW